MIDAAELFCTRSVGHVEIEDVGGSFEYMLHRLESFAVRLEAIKADHAKLLQVAHQKWYEVNFQPWVEMAHRVEVSDGA